MRLTALLVPVLLVAVTSSCTAKDQSAGAATEPRVVEVATDLQFAEDGSVTWAVGKIDTSGNAEPNVVAVSDRTTSARVAGNVELLTPEGCVEPFGDFEFARLDR